MQTDTILGRIDDGLDDSLRRLFDLLRLKSISTDPAFKDECRKAADWMAAQLTEIGIDSSVRPTTGHPMVVGHRKSANPSAPHVLFYGHYDVQPVDPLELWASDPFDPQMVTRDDGSRMIVARGAVDDKGQTMTFVEACRAWITETGDLPISVTVLLEGEEESGSPSLRPFLEANAEELKAEYALVCDTGMWDPDTPAITTMLRGLMGEELEISAAAADLHSGMFGGAAQNPIRVLTRILGGLHDENGRVAVPGFYDGVTELPEEIASQWEALGVTAEKFLAPFGLSKAAGESDRSVIEQIWSRPTCDINGIIGGYTGEGFKTVIAAKARAKVSFRLVGDQDPDRIREAFRAWVTAQVPEDCSVTFHAHGNGRAITLPVDAPAFAKTRSALADEWGRDPVLGGCGGSIPIVGEFRRLLGMDSILVGFGLDDDNMHSPNEKFDLQSFHKGIRSWARIIGSLGGMS